MKSNANFKSMDDRITDYLDQGLSFEDLIAKGIPRERISRAIFHNKHKRKRIVRPPIQDEYTPATASNDGIAVMPKGVPLEDLEERKGCRWPIGYSQHHGDKVMLYCGLKGYPYCEHHKSTKAVRVAR